MDIHLVDTYLSTLQIPTPIHFRPLAVIRLQMAPASPMMHQQVLVRRPVQRAAAAQQTHHNCPMARAIEQVHEACAQEISNTCQAPKPTPQPEDPLEAFFGIGRGATPSTTRQMSADPFAAMRSTMEADPFFRLATTPPSASTTASASALSPFGSSTLLDELFGGDFGRLDRLMDDMMDSALRFGAMASAAGGEGVPMQKTIVRVVNGSPAPVAEEEQEQEEEAPVEDATPADIAEAALEKMVNSFLGHVVSASASKASQATRATQSSEDEVVEAVDAAEEEEEEEEKEEDDHPQAPRASDGDIQREVLSHDDAPSATVDTDVDAIEASYGLNGLDPIAMARSIVQRGNAILQEEQEKEQSEDDDHELRRRRRRLTSVEEGEEAADPTARRRLARRLTEVIPLVGMPTGVTVIPLQDGGLRFLLREPTPFQQQQSRPAPAHHVGPTPRLMLGCGTDNCLWDMFDGRDEAMSAQCADSLSNVRATYSQLVQAEQRKEQEMINALLSEFGLGDERQSRPMTGAQTDPAMVSPVMFWLWLTFFVVSIYACLNAGGDDDDDEEYDDEAMPDLEGPEYVILSDDVKSFQVNHIHISPPCQGFSRSTMKSQNPSEVKVYTGIPVQVV